MENAWIFQNPTKEILAKDRHLADKALMEKDYVPSPFSEHLMDDHEWMHILAALDTCTVYNGPQFCDDDDKEIIPIKMVNLTHYVPKCEDFHLVREAILVTDLSSSEESCHFYEKMNLAMSERIILIWKMMTLSQRPDLEKVRILLREREAIVLDTTVRDLNRKRQKQREKEKEK